MFPLLDTNASPLPNNSVLEVFNKKYPDEGTATVVYAFKLKAGFGYRMLLGQMIYANVICCLASGYAIPTISKFSIK